MWHLALDEGLDWSINYILQHFNIFEDLSVSKGTLVCSLLPVRNLAQTRLISLECSANLSGVILHAKDSLLLSSAKDPCLSKRAYKYHSFTSEQTVEHSLDFIQYK